MGFTSETVAAAAAAYNQEREAESRSHMNADLANEMSMRQSRAGAGTEVGDAKSYHETGVEY